MFPGDFFIGRITDAGGGEPVTGAENFVTDLARLKVWILLADALRHLRLCRLSGGSDVRYGD